MRLFVAAALPPLARERLSSLAARVATAVPGLGAVRAEAMHVTLRFLGELSPEDGRALRSRLASARLVTRAFRALIGGYGQFPQRGSPRVLFAAVRSGEKEFQALWREVVALTEGVGAQEAEELFRPHVTLARNRRAALHPGHPALRELAEALEALELDVEVAGAGLYASELGRGGPRHELLQEVRCAP